MFFFLIFNSYEAVEDYRCVAPTNLPNEPPENYSLYHVQVITRHGQRTPLFEYLPYNSRGVWECDSDDSIAQREEANPTVFYRRYKVVHEKTSFPGNCKAGDLILEGMQQHENLGKAYRKRFVDDLHFIPDYFDPPLFYFTTSYIERTFRSQEAFIVGLYPIRSNNEIIVTETAGEGHSPLFPNPVICKDISDQNDMYTESDEYKNLTQYYDTLKEGMQTVGLTNKSSDIVNFCEWAIATNCKIENSPNFLTQDVIDKCHIVFANGQFVKYSFGERGIAASYILREMLHILEKRIECKSKVKFAHFSAHDSSLAAILVALLPNQKFEYVTPYASHILFESYKGTDNKLYIRYSYNGEILRFEGTDEYGLIEYTQFRKLVNPFLEFCKDVPAPDD